MSTSEGQSGGGGSVLWSLVRLARPHQWAKSGFVLLGPIYGLQSGDVAGLGAFWPALLAAAAFALVSSGLYVINDLVDAERDRAHPRKRHRPIASGVVSPGLALWYAVGLLAAGGVLAALTPGEGRWWVLGLVGIHAANVLAYSWRFKHAVVVDVLSLSLGFVLRVVAGCAAVAIEPSAWLLNATLFVAMFLAFGKRLGELRSLGDGASEAREVLGLYGSESLRMLVVVTGVAALVAYAGYVQSRADHLRELADGAGHGFTVNILWFTMLPAAFGLMRAITLLERGVYDDPTELAMRDRGFQAAVGLFGVITGLAYWFQGGG